MALAARGLARSRSHARELIDGGRVLVNARPANKAAQLVGDDDRLQLTAADPYVSRAAYKLLGALADLRLDVGGRALDAGASTGGFTQVLLERGCRQVVAVDVGHDQLHPDLRDDARVIVHEGVNLRDLDLAVVDGDPVDLVVADVSFISLTLILPQLISVLRPGGILLTMIKPQFEVGRERLGKGGVVRSTALRRSGVEAVCATAEEHGWSAQDGAPSRLPGPAGNVEYFVRFAVGSPDPAVLDRLFSD